MERKFALPVGIAAILHAALLFGISKTPIAAPSVELRSRFELSPIPPAEPEIVPEDETAGAISEKKQPPARPVVTSPETVVIDLDVAFKIPVPPVDLTPRVDSRVIPTGPSGPTTGDGNGPRGIRPVLGTDLDNPPRTRLQPAPIYPHEGRRDGLRGEVWVEFRVDEAGRVADPQVVRSSHRMFEEPTLRAVSRWQFEPGRRFGRIVSFRMAVPVIFTLGD